MKKCALFLGLASFATASFCADGGAGRAGSSAPSLEEIDAHDQRVAAYLAKDEELIRRKETIDRMPELTPGQKREKHAAVEVYTFELLAHNAEREAMYVKAMKTIEQTIQHLTVAMDDKKIADQAVSAHKNKEE